jgi:predicted Zn-dependent protease
LLTDQPKAAYKAASKAVKYNPHDPQARVNLAIAMLETNKKGVRDHIDKANQLMVTSSDLRQELQQNFTDGLKRKPDWKSLQKVQNWLFGS